MPDASSTALNEVKLAIISGDLAKIRSVEAWQMFDELVIKELVGGPPLRSLANQKFLEEELLKQPRLIDGIDTMKTLILLRDAGKAAEIKDLLDDAATICVAYWKDKLGIEKHRPADHDELRKTAECTRLRDQENTWSRVAQSVFPDEFSDSKRRTATIARIRQNVRRFSRARRNYLITHAIAPTVLPGSKSP